MSSNLVSDVRTSAILDALTHRIRVLTIDQLARTWWAATRCPRRNARAAMRRLELDGLVTIEPFLSRPELPLDSPVLEWNPGNAIPDLGRIAYRLRTRWTDAPIPIDFVMATREAMREVGGFIGGYRPRTSETTHDLHVGGVYLRYLRDEPETAEHWISENQLRAEQRGGSDEIPDAVIRTSSNVSPTLVIDFGGSYRKQKLERFHAAHSETPYVIW